jgi:hypothetical protein
MSNMRDVLRGYSRIHMIGDSLLEQHFIGLVCILAPNSTKQMVAQVEDTRHFVWTNKQNRANDETARTTTILHMKAG